MSGRFIIAAIAALALPLMVLCINIGLLTAITLSSPPPTKEFVIPHERIVFDGEYSSSISEPNLFAMCVYGTDVCTLRNYTVGPDSYKLTCATTEPSSCTLRLHYGFRTHAWYPVLAIVVASITVPALLIGWAWVYDRLRMDNITARFNKLATAFAKDRAHVFATTQTVLEYRDKTLTMRAQRGMPVFIGTRVTEEECFERCPNMPPATTPYDRNIAGVVLYGYKYDGELVNVSTTTTIVFWCNKKGERACRITNKKRGSFYFISPVSVV